MKKDRFRKAFFPILLGVLIVLAGLSLVRRTHVVRVYVMLPNGEVILADVADSAETRLMGFFTIGSFADDRGVLFMFEEAGRHSIWGKNIQSPTDMIWLDPNRKIIQIDRNVPPCREEPCPIYEPEEAVLFIMQVTAGVAKQHDLEPGMLLKFQRVQQTD